MLSIIFLKKIIYESWDSGGRGYTNRPPLQSMYIKKYYVERRTNRKQKQSRMFLRIREPVFDFLNREVFLDQMFE